MLAEMDARHPLSHGMKVLDPSCGSGAFLVQTYRMLIERAIRANGGNLLPPSKLRAILQAQIFGVDRDQDACRIAEMSLLVTLLDYVNPPDLEGKYKSFRLPKLAEKNIFQADFFDPKGSWETALAERKNLAPFDWIVGNPPWKEIKSPPKDPRDTHALTWMGRTDAPPTGGNQVAEAFLWKAQPVLNEGGAACLVLPAMTLFKNESRAFRQALFTELEVWSVVNFANLAYVLFSGRSTVPVMSLFFRNLGEGTKSDQPILTYAPLVINQEANRPLKAGKQLDTWSVVVNGSELREVPIDDAVRGEGLTWKLAMWGSFHDRKLLERMQGSFSTLGEFAADHSLTIAEGFQLRDDPIGLKVSRKDGALLATSVVKDGPAAKAGVQEGDAIVKIGEDAMSEPTLKEAKAVLFGGAGSKLKLPVVRKE